LPVIYFNLLQPQITLIAHPNRKNICGNGNTDTQFVYGATGTHSQNHASGAAYAENLAYSHNIRQNLTQESHVNQLTKS